MKKHSFTLFIAGTIRCLLISSLHAQDSTKTEKKEQPVKHEQHFIDEDGDGYNDNAPDHDGDGIPNGLDPDWQKFKQEDVHMDEESKKGESQNLHGEKKGSSLDNKSKEQQQKQQKKQRGKP